MVRIRDKELRTRARPRVAVRHQGPQGGAAALRGRRRDPALPAAGEPARLLSRTPRASSRSSARARIPTRMFAGEGDAVPHQPPVQAAVGRQPANRLSTAFDSVTLYGSDPDQRPDIYGKVGNSGVSIATLDDMKVLYDGFDLCAPTTSVSMTINGPAPIDPGDVHEYGHRPADRRVPRAAMAASPREDEARRSRRGRCRPCAAPCRPTSSRRIRGRTPASSPPSSR